MSNGSYRTMFSMIDDFPNDQACLFDSAKVCETMLTSFPEKLHMPGNLRQQ